MSWFSENVLCQYNLLSPVVLAKFDESGIKVLRDVHWPDANDCLSRVDFERHLVFICSGNGAHFDRCAYIIDLTQYWCSCLPPNVTVYPVSDYDRTATLICIALDRIRFWRRIERTELIILPILADVLKMTIRMNRLSILICELELQTCICYILYAYID